MSPNSSYGNFCSFGTTSLANFNKGSSYPQRSCCTDTSTKGFIFKISMILAIANLRNLAACLDCDVALWKEKNYCILLSMTKYLLGTNNQLLSGLFITKLAYYIHAYFSKVVSTNIDGW